MLTGLNEKSQEDAKIKNLEKKVENLENLILDLKV